MEDRFDISGFVAIAPFLIGWLYFTVEDAWHARTRMRRVSIRTRLNLRLKYGPPMKVS